MTRLEFYCNLEFVNGGGRFNSLNDGQLEVSGATTLANDQDLIVTALMSDITVSGAIVGAGSLVKRGEATLFLRGSVNNTYTGPTRIEAGNLRLAKTSAARAISAQVTIDGALAGSASLADDLQGQYPPALSMLITNNGVWRLTNGATVTNLFLDDADILGTGLLNLECDVIAQGGNRIACSLNLGSQSRTFFVNLAGSSAQLDVSGNIIGPLGANSSGIIKQGEGLLILKNQNTFLGPTLVKEGELYVQHGGALGSAGAGGETRLQGGILRLNGGTFTSPESIVVEAPSTAIVFSGNVTLTGGLTLSASCDFFGGSADRLDISAAINGPGEVRIGGGTVRFSGSGPNTFGGGNVNVAPPSGHTVDAVLELAKPDNVVAVPGEVYLSGSGTNKSQLRSFQNGGVREVVLSFGSSWQMNGHMASPQLLNFFGPSVFVDTGGGQLQFADGAQILNSFGGGPEARIIGRVAFLGQTNDLLLAEGSLLHIDGQVSGGATIRQLARLSQQPGGTLILDGDNQFTGPILVQTGILDIRSDTALGSPAGGTVVNNDAALALERGVWVKNESLTLNTTNLAGLTSLGKDTNTWSGNVVLQRTASIHVPDASGALYFDSIIGCCAGIVSGPGGLTKTGPGGLRFFGSPANTFTGPATITGGLLEAGRVQGPALSSNVVVFGAGSTLRTGHAAGIRALPVAARVSVQEGGVWGMTANNIEILSRLDGDGAVDLGSGSTLIVSNQISCTFSGALSGAGALNKRGPATLQLSGNSPAYTGLATVFDGTYKVDAQILNGPVTVKLGALLRGGGALGNVTVEPGGIVKVDSVSPGRAGGTLVMSSVDFQSSGAVLGLEFFGSHETGGDDGLFVNGPVSLGNLNLSAGFGYAPREGDVLTLITKSVAGAITGVISGFPEGSVQMIGGIPTRVSYAGNDGNDVTLTVTNLPLRADGAQIVSGGLGSVLVPNDCSQLKLVVTNHGPALITVLRGALRSLTDGVIVTIAEADFPNLAPNARGTNQTPFQIRTEPSFPCGGAAQFELVLTASGLPATAILYTFAGASGNALGFDGRNDQAQLPVNAFPAVFNDFTIELWANPTGNRSQTAETNSGVSGVSVPLRQLQRFAVFPDRGDLAYGASHVSAGLSIGRNGISVYEHGNNFLPSRLVYSNAVSGWTHVALVYSNRRPGLYVNGTLARSGLASLAPFVHASGSLGGSMQDDFGNFQGQLDEVRIWNVALNETQIQTNMTRSLTGAEPGLVTYFRCDEDSGGLLTDSAPASPNHNGTLTDGAAFVLSDRGPFTLPGGPACDSGGGPCESCLVVAGQFTNHALTSARRLDISSAQSICGVAKPCPGFIELDVASPVRLVMHDLTNDSPAELCVTVQLRADCPGALAYALSAAAYLGEFRINQPCSNYLGDGGASGPIYAPFSFRVPPLTNIVIVVTEIVPNQACDTYTLEVFGLGCPPPALQLSADANPGNVLAHWSSAYPDFTLQSVNSLDGANPHPFAPVPIEPVLVNSQYVVTNSAAAARQFFRLAK